MKKKISLVGSSERLKVDRFQFYQYRDKYIHTYMDIYNLKETNLKVLIFQPLSKDLADLVLQTLIITLI